MTNEELVSRIQNGETDLMYQLWAQVEKFVYWKAKSAAFAFNGNGGVSIDDLYNTGYIAMVEASNTYKPIGMNFLSWFAYYLKTAFAEASGFRTEKAKNNPLQNAVSLSHPLGDGDSDGTISELIPDPESDLQFESIENQIMADQLSQTFSIILHEIPTEQSETLRKRYFEGKTLDSVAADLNKTAAEIRTLEAKGIRTLRQPRYAIRLQPFYNFDYYYGTGLKYYQNTGTSIQERYVIKAEKANNLAGL